MSLDGRHWINVLNCKTHLAKVAGGSGGVTEHGWLTDVHVIYVPGYFKKKRAVNVDYLCCKAAFSFQMGSNLVSLVDDQGPIVFTLSHRFYFSTQESTV